MTILEEARHSLIIIEHDPLLYEDAQGMVEYVSQGLHDAAKEAAVLLYSPGTDTFLEDMTRNADRVFYFDEGPRAIARRLHGQKVKAKHILLSDSRNVAGGIFRACLQLSARRH
jgi:hypothetical protein